MPDELADPPEELEFFNNFFRAIETVAEAIKDIELLMPAIVIASRMYIIQNMDKTDPVKWKARKELIYLMEREIIGAWIVKNSQSTAGEGAGLLLMGYAPFADKVANAVVGAADAIADATNTAWDNMQRNWSTAFGLLD